MLAAGQRIGNYVVEAPLGRGGMAEVWRARHAKLGSVHALKVLLPEAARQADVRARFLTEGRIQAQIRHEGLVPVTDLLEEGEQVGLVMDYVEGEGLDAFLRAGEPPPELLRRVFLQVLEALDVVHAAGIVHRDLKPTNILVDRKDGRLRARVLDFGIAHVATPEGHALTRQGMTLGTVYFMSPEQVRGEAITPASDIFSLGIILYRAVTGKLPFDGDSQWKILTAISEAKYPPPEQLRPSLDPALAAVIRKALAARPEERFASCGEFARALAQALPATKPELEVLATGTDGPTRPPLAARPRTSPRVEPRREAAPEPGPDEATEADLAAIRGPRRWPYALVALLLVACGVLAWLAFFHRPQRSGASRRELEEIVREAVRVEPKSGLAFVRLPGGRFVPGCRKDDALCGPDEPRAQEPVVTEGFWLARTETTVEAYARCAKAGACTAKAKDVKNAAGQTCNWGRQLWKHPVNCVTLEEAEAFCDWAGGRLPTPIEWEYAARSGRAVLFPWGDEPPGPQHARFAAKAEKTAEVGAHPAGATPWGLQDLAGNVWEWTVGELRKRKEVRGGSFASQARWLRASNRFSVAPDERSDSVGFRCAMDKTPEQ